MVCMGCQENFPRKYIYICQGCKAWYCKECTKDHIPCNRPKSPVSSSGQDPTLVTSKPQFESEHGLSVPKCSIQKTIDDLSKLWLNTYGVAAIYDDVREKEKVVVIIISDDCRSDFPNRWNGYRIIVEKGKQFQAESAIPVDEQPVKTVRKREPFNLQIFQQFQAKAGCVTTQDIATQLWREVMKSLTQAEKDDILDAWGEVNKGKSRRHAVLECGHKCLLDEVCDKIVSTYVKSNDFVG